MLDESTSRLSPDSTPQGSSENSSTYQPSIPDQNNGAAAALTSTAECSSGDDSTNQPVLQQSQSFFSNSSRVETKGGQFVIATGVNLNNNTYNYHYGYGTGEIGAQNQIREDVKMMSESDLRSAENPLAYTEHLSFPIMNSLDIYGRHLAVKRRGYPLWIPDPDINSPLEHQRQGVSIGDVGIITESGNFDFKFNICRPGDHPVNVGEVPDDFKPFEPTLKDTDIRRLRELKVDSFIASASVTRSHGHENRDDGSESHGISFEATASEGAILAIPNGADSENLKHVAGFRRYVADNLLSWYQHMKDRGCEVKNGDIRLVIGTDKTTAWGMAVFASLSDKTDKFRLNFKPTAQRSRGAMYDWECSGTSDVKSGPDAVDIAALRCEDDRDGEVPAFCNQCLFVRTLNAMLPDNVWKTLEPGDEVSQDNQSSSAPDNTKVQFIDSHLPPTYFNSLSSSGQPSQHQGSLGRQVAISNAQASENVAHAVHLASLTINQFEHPSKALNEVLLKQHPSSKIVITEDNDWVGAITTEDKILPCSEELVSRILSKNTICQEEGTLYLKEMSAEGDAENTASQGRLCVLVGVDPHGLVASVIRDSRGELNNILSDEAPTTINVEMVGTRAVFSVVEPTADYNIPPLESNPNPSKDEIIGTLRAMEHYQHHLSRATGNAGTFKNVLPATYAPSSISPQYSQRDSTSSLVRQPKRRGGLSCAECRRLKLKCDRMFPCGTCVRRGCEAICPDGSLVAAQGNRFPLTNAVHEKVDVLVSRVRELEDGLADVQSRISHTPHPLLSEDLLRFKRPLEPESLHARQAEKKLKTEHRMDLLNSLGA